MKVDQCLAKTENGLRHDPGFRGDPFRGDVEMRRVIAFVSGV